MSGFIHSDFKGDLLKKNRFSALKLCLVCIAVIILILCYGKTLINLPAAVLKALSPVIFGFVIAYALNILMCFFERLYFPRHRSSRIIAKTKRPVCLALAVFSLAAVISSVIGIVIPELFSCIGFIASELPLLADKLFSNRIFTKLVPKDVLDSLNNFDWQRCTSACIEYLVNGFNDIPNKIINAVTSLFSGVVGVFISFITALYILASKETLISRVERLSVCYLPQKFRTRLFHILSVFNDSFRSFIIGQCIEAFILGILCTVGMLIFGFPYATMIGALVGITAVIPVAGAFIGAGVGTIMIFTVSPFKSLLFLIFFLVLQQIEENLIYPKVVGKSVGLPSLLVLISVTFGAGIGGICGILLSVPIASALYRLLCENVSQHEETLHNSDI